MRPDDDPSGSHAGRPLLSEADFGAVLDRQSQIRVGATVAWTVLTALSGPASRALGAGAVVVWLVLSAALFVWARRADAATGFRLAGQRVSPGDGALPVDAEELGRAALRPQTTCLVAGLLAFWLVRQWLSSLVPVRDAVATDLLVYVIAGAAAVGTYLAVRRSLERGAAPQA